MIQNAFYFIFKALFVLKILSFCLDFLVTQKRLDSKYRVKIKIYNFTTRLTNNYNTHIAQYLTKSRQPDNFFFKNYAENEAGRLVPDLFLFFKKSFYEVKANGLQLSFNIVRQPLTCHIIKTNCIKLQTIDPAIEISSILILQERFWEQFLNHILCIIFQEKFLSCYILLTDQISQCDCLYFLRYWAV